MAAIARHALFLAHSPAALPSSKQFPEQYGMYPSDPIL